MVETFGPAFFHVHIETSAEVRESRIEDRKIEDIPVQESSYDPVESGIGNLVALSNLIVSNDGKLPKLYTQIDSHL
jgi:hypothetical protein